LTKIELLFSFPSPPWLDYGIHSAPVLAPSLPSCRSRCHSIAAKTKAPDDDNIRDDRVGMVVAVVAVSGTITFVPVNRCPPCLVNDRYPIAIPLPLLI
jgi:hypothetical protein